MIAVIVVVDTTMLVVIVEGVGERVLRVPGLLFDGVVFASLVMDTFFPAAVLVGSFGLVVTTR